MQRPVVLVPGWRDRARAMRHLRQHLIHAGWSPTDVSVVEFQDRFGSNTDHAGELAKAIDSMGTTGAASVDLVAHSMGGLAVRYLLNHSSQRHRVRRVIFLGTPHRGTLAAYFGWGAGAAQMRARSEFLRLLGDHSDCPAELIAIHTPLDFRIFPGSSAQLPSGRNLRVWCLGHRSLLRSPHVLRLVQNLLQEE